MITQEEADALLTNPVFKKKFQEWWDKDFSWEGLEAQSDGSNYFAQLLAHLNQIAPQKVSFADREWSRFHLPPFDPDGNLSPRSSWTGSDQKALAGQLGTLTTRFKAGLNGFVWDNGENCKLAVGNGTSLFVDSLFFIPLSWPQTECNGRFENSLFSQAVELTGKVFSKQDVFRGSTFCSRLELKTADFAESQRFDGSDFFGPAQFIGLKGLGKVYFLHSNFHDVADFSGSSLQTELAFADVSFLKVANFRNARFPRIAAFSDVRFHGPVNLREATFNISASFTTCRFNKDTDFTGTKFAGVEFTDVTFLDRANFGGSTLRNISRFHCVTFSEDADFSAAAFLGSTAFAGVIFEKGANFNGGEENQSNKIGPITFCRSPSEDQTRFNEPLSLNDRDFAGKTTFNSVTFSHGIELYNSKLHPDTTFFDCTWETSQRQSVRRGEAELKRLEASFRSAKTAVDAIDSRFDFYNFHALELETRRRNPYTSMSERVFSTIYKLVSNYGRSLSLPVRRFLEMTTLFGVMYYCIGTLIYRNDGLGCPSFIETLNFTLSNSLRPFSIFSQSQKQLAPMWFEMISENTFWYVLVTLVGSVQSILTITLGTLFVFAIRRHFQINQ